MGDLGFWIFISALIVGGMWLDWQKKAAKHETLRRIVEKTGTLDEAKLKALFNDDDEESATKPGYAYRGLRICGVIVLSLAAAIATFFLIAAGVGKLFGPVGMFNNITGLIGGLAVSASIAVLGLGLFFSSRFATPPADSRNEPPAH